MPELSRIYQNEDITWIIANLTILATYGHHLIWSFLKGLHESTRLAGMAGEGKEIQVEKGRRLVRVEWKNNHLHICKHLQRDLVVMAHSNLLGRR